MTSTELAVWSGVRPAYGRVGVGVCVTRMNQGENMYVLSSLCMDKEEGCFTWFVAFGFAPAFSNAATSSDD